MVVPALMFGCHTVPLRSTDVDTLDSVQSRCIKAALGLSKCAHHSALLIALKIPRIQEILRRAVVFALLGIFRDDHRLKHIALSELAVLATEPERLGTRNILAPRVHLGELFFPERARYCKGPC